MKKQNKYIPIITVVIVIIGGIYLYLNRPQYEPRDERNVAVSEEDILVKEESQEKTTQKTTDDKLAYSDSAYEFTFEYPKAGKAIVETNNLDTGLLQLIKVKINDDAGYIDVKIYDKENYTSIGDNYPPVFKDEVKEFISSPEGYKDEPLKCWPDINQEGVSGIPPAPPAPCNIDIIKTTATSLPAIQTSYSSMTGYACEIIFTNDKYIFVIGQKKSPCLDGNPEYYQSLPENIQEEWVNFRQLLTSFKFN